MSSDFDRKLDEIESCVYKHINPLTLRFDSFVENTEWNRTENSMSVEQATRLVAILNKIPLITNLVISGMSFNRNVIAILADGIKNNNTITSLTLNITKGYDRVDSTLQNQFISALSENKRLKKLTIMGYLSTSEALALAQVLASPTSELENLTLEGCNLSLEDEKKLANALASNKKLCALTMTRDWMGTSAFDSPAGGTAIAQAIRNHPVLRFLFLPDNSGISDEMGLALAKMLASNTPLTTLDLHNNAIGEKAAVALGKALMTNTSLQILNLSQTKLGFDSIFSLAQALVKNKTLRDLNITINEFEIAEVSLIAEGLRHNKGLNTLKIGGGLRNTPGMIEFLAGALMQNRTLTHLNITTETPTEKALVLVASAVSNNFSILELNIYYSHWTSDFDSKRQSYLTGIKNYLIRNRNHVANISHVALPTRFARAIENRPMENSINPLMSSILDYAGMKPSMPNPSNFLDRYGHSLFFQAETSSASAVELPVNQRENGKRHTR